MKRVILIILMLAAGLIPAQAQDSLPFKLVDVLERGWIETVHWAEGGKTIAVTSAAGIWLYQADDLSLPARHIPFDAPPVITFDPTGEIMAVAEDGGIGLYDVSEGRRYRLLKSGYAVYRVLEFNSAGTQLAAVVDTNFLAAGAFKGENGGSFIHVWGISPRMDPEEPPERLPLRVYINPELNPPQAVAFSPDGTSLAVVADYVGFDFSVWLFFMLDLESGEVLTEADYRGHLSKDYTLDDARLVIAPPYYGLRYALAFDPEPERFGAEFIQNVDQQMEVMDISQDARLMVVVQSREHLDVQETMTGETIVTLPTFDSEAIVLAPDNTRLALFNEAGQLAVYEIAALTPDSAPCGETSAAACISYTDAHIPQPISTQNHQHDVSFEPEISASGQWEIVEGPDKEGVSTYDLVNTIDDTTITLAIDAIDPNITDAQFNADESLVAVAFTSYYMDGTLDNMVRVWDLRRETPDPDPIAILPHAKAVGPIAFSPDGSLLVTTSDNGDVFVWETMTWEMVTSLPHPLEVMQFTLSDDNMTLETLAEDGLHRVFVVDETP